MARKKAPSFTTPPLVPFHEPDLSAPLKAAVVEAIRQAWLMLRKKKLVLLKSGEEEAITHELWRILNAFHPKTGERLIAVLSMFEMVHREAAVTSNDGGYRKMPDLLFRPDSRHGVLNGSDWGFWVEAKIINNASHPVNLYVKQGVDRFESGQYAARMPSGALVAYVRDGSAVKPALAAHGIAIVSDKTADFGRSQHDRSTAVPPMVAIELAHLWLDAA